MRQTLWVGSSKEDISAMPGYIKDIFGYRLQKIQAGKTPEAIKPYNARVKEGILVTKK